MATASTFHANAITAALGKAFYLTMKSKVPKQHNFNSLPVFCRVRYMRGAKLVHGTIMEAQDEAGNYRVRRQHTWVHFKLSPKAIKFIDFHPTCPPCPAPRSSMVAYDMAKAEVVVLASSLQPPPPRPIALAGVPTGPEAPVVEIMQAIAKGQFDDVLASLAEEVRARRVVLKKINSRTGLPI